MKAETKIERKWHEILSNEIRAQISIKNPEQESFVFCNSMRQFAPLCSSFPSPFPSWLSLKLENGVGAYKAKSIE